MKIKEVYLSDNQNLKKSKTLLGYKRVKSFNHTNYKNKLLKVVNDKHRRA